MARYDQCDATCTTDCGHCKGAGKPVEVTEVSTVRKDRGGQRGHTHIVRSWDLGQTWCGSKPRGLARWQARDTLGSVTCMTCLRAFGKGQPHTYTKR